MKDEIIPTHVKSVLFRIINNLNKFNNIRMVYLLQNSNFPVHLYKFILIILKYLWLFCTLSRGFSGFFTPAAPFLGGGLLPNIPAFFCNFFFDNIFMACMIKIVISSSIVFNNFLHNSCPPPCYMPASQFHRIPGPKPRLVCTGLAVHSRQAAQTMHV